MNEKPTKSDRGLSKSMAILSVLLHLLALAAIMVFSSMAAKTPEKQELKVSGIKLAPALEIPRPKAEQLRPINEETHLDELFENMAQRVPKLEPGKKEPRRIKTAALPKNEKKKIKPVAKRKPKKSKDQTKAKPKPKKKTPKPEEKPRKEAGERPEFDPQKHLAQRLEQLRQRVTTRNEQTADAWEKDAAAGSVTVDPETIEWFRKTRERINKRWTVIERDSMEAGTTVIGVRLGRDGALISASIEAGSGDEGLDLSALRAVRLAAPFPQLPERLRKKIEESGGLALRFSPSGVM
jgi:protein TonB